MTIIATLVNLRKVNMGIGGNGSKVVLLTMYFTITMPTRTS